MSLLTRLNRPWVHFIVLGSLLFYLQGCCGRQGRIFAAGRQQHGQQCT